MEADQNLMMLFQRTTMSVDDYTRESKVCVEVYKESGLIPGATEVVTNIVVEKENLTASTFAGNKLKAHLKKGGEQWHATLNF